MTRTRCTTRSGIDRNIASQKRLEISFNILAILALFLCPPAIAQEQNGWQFDSLRANPNISVPGAQQVDAVVLKRLDRWNAHDIEGFMQTYWKSPELLVVVNSE